MATLEALRAVAVEQAASAESAFVGSEHLFLAWLMVADGPAHEAAIAAGITPDSFRALVGGRASVVRRSAAVEAGGLSSHAQRVITVAEEIATADGRPEANADDALLAMIREPRGAIARALNDAKVKPSHLKTLARPQGARSPATARREPKPPREEGNASDAVVAAPRERPARAERADKTERAPRAERPAERSIAPKPRRDPETDDIPEARAPARPRLTPPPKPPRVTSAPATSTRRWSMFWVLYLAVPLSLWLHFSGADPLTVFFAACVGIVPLAGLISTATEHLAERTGPMIGALLNASFGNATEVIVAIVALNAGLVELVKASLVGSILSNLLLIMGLALMTGGFRQSVLKFNRTAAGMGAAMLALAVAALVLPSLVAGVAGGPQINQLSGIVAGILALTYIGSLVFTLRTHRRIFAGDRHESSSHHWPVLVAVVVLGVAAAAVAVESEFLVDTIGSVSKSLGWSQVFIGLIVIPIVGNAAEHASAVVAARKGNTELALQIALGSSTQVALMVAPLLVLVGALIGQPMTLVFPTFQVAALGIAVVVSSFITLDGESHWFEGAQLLALYAMIAAAAWFI